VLTTLLATGTGAVAGVLAWHRCRALPGSGAITWLLAPAGAALGAAAAVFVADVATTIILLHLLLAALPLAAIDARTRTLPSRHVLATYPTTALVTSGTALSDGPPRLVGVALGAALLWAFLLTLAHTGGLGAGDVRLAPVLGAHLGHAGLATVAVGTIAAFALGAAAVAVLAVTRGHDPDRRLPFAPALLTGAVLALLV